MISKIIKNNCKKMLCLLLILTTFFMSLITCFANSVADIPAKAYEGVDGTVYPYRLEFLVYTSSGNKSGQVIFSNVPLVFRRSSDYYYFYFADQKTGFSTINRNYNFSTDGVSSRSIGDKELFVGSLSVGEKRIYRTNYEVLDNKGTTLFLAPLWELVLPSVLQGIQGTPVMIAGLTICLAVLAIFLVVSVRRWRRSLMR